MKTNQQEQQRYARVSGSPGAKPRLVGFTRALWPVFLLLFVAGYLVRTVFPYPALGPMAVGLCLLFLCLVLGGALLRAERGLSLYIKGARGEERVASELSRMPDAFEVFHGVPLTGQRKGGAGDIDHVVIGPTGVFVVETKNWSGAIRVQGGRIMLGAIKPSRSPAEQARKSGRQLERFLREAAGVPITVQPVLCFAGNNLEHGSTGMSGVRVYNACDLREGLQHSVEQPLEREIQERISAALIELVDG
jgi:hypothetical protein